MAFAEVEGALADYVLQETNREAVDVDHEQTFTLDAGAEIHVATVTVQTGNEYWAVAGDTPMAVYRYAEFADADAVLAEHAESVGGLEGNAGGTEGP